MNFQVIVDDVILGKDVQLGRFINLYGCEIGDNTKVGAFVEIQKNAKIGKNYKISLHTFFCEGVTIGDNCFIGHGVTFINDNHPRSVNAQGDRESEKDWIDRFVNKKIGNNVSIGSRATVLDRISIYDGAMIGAGSTVTKNVPNREIWAGNPAKYMCKI